MPGPRRLIPLVVALVVVAAGIRLLQGGHFDESGVGPGASGEPPSGSGRGARVGSPAPDFVLRDLEGKPVRLTALRGNAVVLSFWATWCPSCRAEMPDLGRIDREYRDRGVIVLAVNQMESRETVRAYLSELGLQLSVVVDPLGGTAQLYRVSALPTMFFIDESGLIRETRVGPLSLQDIIEILDRTR